MTVLRGAAEKLGIVLQLQTVNDPDQFERALGLVQRRRGREHAGRRGGTMEPSVIAAGR